MTKWPYKPKANKRLAKKLLTPATYLAPHYGRTAGDSTVIPLARLARYASSAVSSAATNAYGSARTAVMQPRSRRCGLHTLLDLRGAIPIIHISDGKTGDVSALDLLCIEAGAFYVMDRGYLDYSRLYALHRSGAFFITRAKRDMNARPLYSAPNNREDGVICDQRTLMNRAHP